LTWNFVVVTIAPRCKKNGKSEGNIEGLLKRRDAALQLGFSFLTIMMSSGFTRRRFEAIGLQENIIVSRRAKWTDCFSERVATPSNNAKKKSGAV
jgi:hypothetical protein